MKKVYIPTMDELYQMQDITDGHSIYKYILIKAIESLIIDGINYPNKGMLKSAYKYLRENPDIAYAICKLYPEEIKYSEYAKNTRNQYLQQQINSMEYDEYIGNVQGGMEDDISSLITKRKNYLETLQDSVN